jgi:hypothetical protein
MDGLQDDAGTVAGRIARERKLHQFVCPSCNESVCGRKIKGICRSCYEKQLLASNPEYRNRQLQNAKGWKIQNKKRISRQGADYRAKIADVLYHRQRRDTLKKYGITQHDFDCMLARQGDCCAICGKHKDDMKTSMHVDHCHVSGRVRGLLCFRCNYGISWFQDNPVTLDRASKYLLGET